MKTFFPIVFLAALFWQPFYQTAYIIYWKTNQEKIVKTECINRFKPMMHCNGKCQLYKQLKKAAEEEAENNKLPMAVLKLKSPDAFTIAFSVWQPLFISACKNTVYQQYSTSKLNAGFCLSQEKPPRLHCIL